MLNGDMILATYLFGRYDQPENLRSFFRHGAFCPGWHHQGVLISDVEADSPAAQVGLQAGQPVEEVNRTRVHNLKELQLALKKTDNPKQVLLRVRSGDHSQYVVLQGQ